MSNSSRGPGRKSRQSSAPKSSESKSFESSRPKRRRPKHDRSRSSDRRPKKKPSRPAPPEPTLELWRPADDTPETKFVSLPLADSVAEAISQLGYETATPIQAATITPAIEGRDILGCAQTGTGKTAAFLLPILTRIAASPGKSVPHQPRVLILAPTRELAAQIHDSCTDYGRQLRLRTTVIFGGVGQSRQVKALQRGVHILIATPGRLIDLMDQGHIDLSGLDTFVLDEADRMLDMGFLPALKRIISELPEQRQSLFFSATLSKDVIALVEDLLRDPFAVDVTPPERSVDLIEQSVEFVSKKAKPERLFELLSDPAVGQAVVFTRTKRGANTVAERLMKRGLRAEAIHGNKSQNARTRTLAGFRGGRVQILVATDLAARGLDIDDVTHVINYELPMEPESYVHRIGRTGRAGAAGTAITLCDVSERNLLNDIERLIEREIPSVTPVREEPSAHQKSSPSNSTRSGSSNERPHRPRKKRPSGQGGPRDSKRPAKKRAGRSRRDDQRDRTDAPNARSSSKPSSAKKRPAKRRGPKKKRSRPQD